jgi:DNA-binding response OmpR family regulator
MSTDVRSTRTVEDTPPLGGVTVLVVEDEMSITRLVRLYLEAAGATVLEAHTGLSAIEMFERDRPHLIVLDLMLPDLDGWEVCRRIRQCDETPIVMLTARETENDRVRGLDLGADDYVTKPFSPRELVSRIRAILRRAGGAEAIASHAVDRLEYPGLTVFPLTRRAEVEGRPVLLTRKEFDLLYILARAPDRVFTRQALFSQVWGFDYLGDSRTVDVHVGTLRKKLEAWTRHRYIRTVRGSGYRFDVTAPSDGDDG